MCFWGMMSFCMQVTIGLTGRKFQHVAQKSSVTEIWNQSRMITSFFAINCDVFCKTAEITNQIRRIYKPNSPNLLTKLAEFAFWLSTK